MKPTEEDDFSHFERQQAVNKSFELIFEVASSFKRELSNLDEIKKELLKIDEISAVEFRWNFCGLHCSVLLLINPESLQFRVNVKIPIAPTKIDYHPFLELLSAINASLESGCYKIDPVDAFIVYDDQHYFGMAPISLEAVDFITKTAFNHVERYIPAFTQLLFAKATVQDALYLSQLDLNEEE